MNIIVLRATQGGCFALVCAILLGTKPASALSCATNYVRAPEDGAIDVPTNARIWGYPGNWTRF